jgi:hypothetical protein
LPVNEPAAADVRIASREKILALSPSMLDDYRQRLQTKGWSTSTMHRDFLVNCPPNAAPSHGQCGVSSFWLIEKLQADHGIAASYCYGDVLRAGNGSPIVARHCWVEVGEADKETRVIVDVTWDQVSGLSRNSVLCETYEQLLSQESIDYAARLRMSRDQLRTDPSFWDRFLTLKKALNEEVL